MRVFVLGGTGAIGGHAVPALIDAGHRVTALARTSAKAEELGRHGATAVSVSMFDTRALSEALEGHDAVVNLASALPPTLQFIRRRAWRENDRVRVAGSRSVVDAASGAGVPRLVQESVSMLYPDCGEDWVDESTPPDEFPASRGNLAAERNADRFTRGGRNGVVLRFGWFIGAGARHAEEFVQLARWHLVPVLGPPHTYISSIHLEDAARAVVAALDAPAGVYNVVDDEPLTKVAFADALADAVGKKAWVRGPGRAALLLGNRLTSLTRSIRASNRRFRMATGWRPWHASAREAWRATVSTLYERSGRTHPTDEAFRHRRPE